MTVAIDHHSAPLNKSEQNAGQSAWLARLRTVFTALSRLAARIWMSHCRSRAIRDLQALDDRILADIGLSRCEILHYVHHRRPSELTESGSPPRPSGRPQL